MWSPLMSHYQQFLLYFENDLRFSTTFTRVSSQRQKLSNVYLTLKFNIIAIISKWERGPLTNTTLTILVIFQIL